MSRYYQNKKPLATVLAQQLVRYGTPIDIDDIKKLPGELRDNIHDTLTQTAYQLERQLIRTKEAVTLLKSLTTTKP